MMQWLTKLLGISTILPPLVTRREARRVERTAELHREQIARLDAWSAVLAQQAGEIERHARGVGHEP